MRGGENRWRAGARQQIGGEGVMSQGGGGMTGSGGGREAG